MVEGHNTRVLSVRYYTKADNPSELTREGKTKISKAQLQRPFHGH